MERQLLPVGEPFGSSIGSLRPHKFANNQKRVLSDTLFLRLWKNIEKAAVLGPPQTLWIELPLQREHRSCMCARSCKSQKKTSKMNGKQALGPPKLPKSIAGTRQKIKELKKTIKESQKRVQSRMGQASSRMPCSQLHGYMEI